MRASESETAQRLNLQGWLGDVWSLVVFGQENLPHKGERREEREGGLPHSDDVLGVGGRSRRGVRLLGGDGELKRNWGRLQKETI